MKKYLLISLSNKFGSKVSEDLANKLGLYFLNIDEYIEYVLMDSQKMLAECGKVYYDSQELKSIEESLDFINTLYYCSYEVFINHKTLFKNNFQIFYIYLPLNILEEQKDSNFVINKIAYENRDKSLTEIAKTIKSKNNSVSDFVQQLEKMLR